MLPKKDRMKKSKLSSTVLDYYHKYGQNRDLEKYLRTRRSTSKSSSDSSLKNYTASDLTGDSKRIAKSMEKLNLSGRKEGFDENDEKKASKSAEHLDDAGKKSNDHQKPSEPKQSIKIEKKAHQQWKSKSKSKSYNFNLESSIEINLPVSNSLPTLSTTVPTIDSIPKATRVLQLESCETQTEPFQMKAMPPVPSISVDQTPTAVEKKCERPKPTPENVQETSPASSVASAIVRLEWDSMADIGYNRIIDFKSQSNSNLTTFEKSALTKFFAKRGLNFDESLVILAPTDTKSPLQRREFTQSAIEMRDAHKIKREFTKLTPTSSKRLWEKALQKYREKYGKSEAEMTSDVDTTNFLAPHHSTPLPGHIVSQLGDEHSIKPPSQKPVDMVPQRRKEQGIEKWCQTSVIDVEAIGIQVEQPQVMHTSRSVQIDIEQVHESTQKDDEDVTTATSFEFLTPSIYKNQQMNRQAAAIAIPSTSQEIPKRDDTQNESAYIQLDNPDDKENIPPIDDKENIPPPPLHAMHRNDDPIAFKTPENTITKPIEMSMLPNDLQKGVDLINALIDSRTTDSVTKKKLIRKIIHHLLKSRDTKDITQMIMSYSDKSSTKISGISLLSDLEKSDQSVVVEKTGKDTISGVSTLSSSSGSVAAIGEQNQIPEKSKKAVKREKKNKVGEKSEKETEKSKETEKPEATDETGDKTDGNDEKEVKEWLLPITQSEIDKENSRKLQSMQQQIDSIQDDQQKDIPTEDTPNIPNPQLHPMQTNENISKSSEIFEFLQHEKRTHFNWIDQEIEHLKNLKLLLHNITPNDSDESKENVSEEKINSVYAKHNRDYLTIYENFRRSGKHMSRNGSQADVSSTLIDSSKSSDENSRFLERTKMGSKSHWIHKSMHESPSSTISEATESKHHGKESINQRIKSKVSKKLPEWDSHSNMQQLVKNRTKLKTPNSDESIEAYAKACRDNFDRKCAKTQPDGKNGADKKCARDQPIYTKPYSSYSDIQNMRRSNEGHLKDKQNDIVDTYTSVTESDGFLSPNSISIGVAANSTSNTTTHQYDTKISIGLQTTSTLKRMPIIQLKKTTTIPDEPVTDDPLTVRVNKLTINKQLQVRPESLAYIIMFEEEQTANKNAISQECGNQLYANSNRINSAESNVIGHDPITSDASNRETKRTDVKEQTTQFTGRSNSTGSSATFEDLTLQEYLQARRPDFYANAEQRRKCLNDLHNLRQQRNEQRTNLFAMNICTNVTTFNRNMKRLLPPPPLAQMRIFKTKEIRSRTRRKYQKLPEILKRQQMERDKKIRRNHRMLVNVFNKNLQKHVLSGQTDLSNSMTIN